MGKHKVGDKVTIKSKEWFEKNKKNLFNHPSKTEYCYVRCGDLNMVSGQTEYCGKEAIILTASGNCYHLDVDNMNWLWNDLMLEEMTKEEAKQSLFYTKVYVDGKSKEIQEKLFELGFKWYLGKEAGHTDKPFLYLEEDKTLSCGDDMEFYKDNKAREVSADYILNLKWDEEAPISKSFFEMIDYPYIIINGRNIKTEIENPNDKWKKVHKPKTASELNTFDKCLVCSGKGCVWVPEIYGYKSDKGNHYLIGHHVSSEHIIPYDESLLGKLYNNEDEKP